MKPLLSISIPTYNRSHYLKDCLKSIQNQLDTTPHLKDLVEVVISDNASTDKTKEVAESFRSIFKNFVYHVNEANVGFDLNVLSSVTHAHGTYCWYLGDDDTIVQGGISAVIEKIKTDTYDVITVESEPLNEAIDQQSIRQFNQDAFTEVTDHNDFYFKGYCQGGLSVLLFNREMWASVVDVKDFKLHWLYYETILKMLVATKKPMLYVNKPVIITGQDCRWAENGTELFTFVNSNVLQERMIPMGFDENRIKQTLIENSKKIILILLRAKGHGLPLTFANLSYIYKNLTHIGYAQKILIALIFFIPNTFIVGVRNIKKIILNQK